MTNENIYQELKNGMTDLEKNIDKFTPESCETTTLEVLKDSKVQEAFVEHILQEYDFNQIMCKPFGIDQTKITFYFRCRPPTICFIHPAIEVTYDPSLKKIVEIRKIFSDRSPIFFLIILFLFLVFYHSIYRSIIY